MDYQLVENLNTPFAVGSVLTKDGKRIFYRNIGKKHIFDKGWQAIFMDDIVYRWLKEFEQIEDVVYDYDGVKTYRVKFAEYGKPKPVFMAGRHQRGVGLMTFDQIPQPTVYARPYDRRVIEFPQKKEEPKKVEPVQTSLV